MEEPRRINLTEAKQRMLFEAVRRKEVPEGSVQAELADGATVPADITLEPVPQAVVVQKPMIERYRVFVANDQVVLVDPDTRARRRRKVKTFSGAGRLLRLPSPFRRQPAFPERRARKIAPARVSFFIAARGPADDAPPNSSRQTLARQG
jgi:hypothetical protein